MHAVFPSILHGHDFFYFRKAADLPLVNALGSQIIPPCADGIIQAIFLHVHAGGDHFCPVGHREARHVRHAHQNQISACFCAQFLPSLRKPGIREVLQLFWIIFGFQKRICYFLKCHKVGIYRIDPICHALPQGSEALLSVQLIAFPFGGGALAGVIAHLRPALRRRGAIMSIITHCHSSLLKYRYH